MQIDNQLLEQVSMAARRVVVAEDMLNALVVENEFLWPRVSQGTSKLDLFAMLHQAVEWQLQPLALLAA